MAVQSKEARAIFLDAIDQPAGSLRAQFLDRACAGRPDLQKRVEALIASHELLGSFQGDHPTRLPATLNAPLEKPGARIGPYRLLEQIGEGGFGVVYMAEQQKPVRRRVAMKIIKPGMDTKEVIARFEAERQALALMDHPNIAKVFDAGTTGEFRNADCGLRIPPTDAACGSADNPQSDIRNPQSGRPYFVMELVRGLPITEFCDEQQLTTRERLQLFVDVCRAVQHAHQKGIIHRDLKPSNVLVTLDDDRPVPKVIDFGIAKALSQHLTEKTLFTAYGQMVGTPLYMAPEQAQMSMHDVDTRSDVYSLGVLLYELLTGTTPFDREALQKSGLDEMRRIICEVEPPRPSARVSTLNADALSTVSGKRGIDARKLAQSLRGELDWIAMKALEKDRKRRYESASAFAADVERYLADEPVQACPPSVGYRLRKFARRNRRWLATAGGFVLLLVAAVVGLSIGLVALKEEQQRTAEQKDVADRQRKLAERKRRLSDANLRAGFDALERFYMRIGERGVLRGPRATPLHPLVGQDNDQYRQLLEDGLRFYEQFAKTNHDDASARYEVGRAWQRVGRLQQWLDRHQEAERAYRTSIDVLERVVKEFPERDDARETLAMSNNDLGGLSAQVCRDDEVERPFRRALALYRELVKRNPGNTRYKLLEAGVLANLEWPLEQTGRTKEAGAALREAIAIVEQLRKTKPKDPQINQMLGVMLGRLAGRRNEQGAYAEAERLLNRAIGRYKVAIDASAHHRFVYHLCTTYSLLAHSLAYRGRHRRALQAFEKQAALAGSLVKDFPRVTAYHEILARSFAQRARVLEISGRVAEAIAIYRKALADYRRLGEGAWRIHNATVMHLRTQQRYASLLWKLRRFADAETELRRGIKLYGQLPPDRREFPDHRSQLAMCYNGLGAVEFATGRRAEAQKSFDLAEKIGRRLAEDAPADGDHRNNLATTLNNQAFLFSRTGKLDEALAKAREALAIQEKLVARPPTRDYRRELLALIHFNLAGILKKQQRFSEADKHFVRAVAVAQQLVKDFPGVPLNRAVLAQSHYERASGLQAAQQPLRARKACEAARAIQQQLIREFPRVADYHNDLGLTLRKLADLCIADKDDAAARKLLEQAVRHHATAVGLFGKDAMYRRDLGWAYWTLGDVLLRLGDYAEAFAIAERLWNVSPDWRQRNNAIDLSVRSAGRAQRDRKLNAAARADRIRQYIGQAREFVGRADASFPGTAEVRHRLGIACHAIGWMLYREGNLQDARDYLEKAVSYQRAALGSDPPKELPVRDKLRSHYRRLGEVLVELRDHARMSEVAAQLIDAFPDEAKSLQRARALLFRSSRMAEPDKKLTAAARRKLMQRYYRDDIKLLEAWIARFPEQDSAPHNLAMILALCPIETLRDPKRAVALARQAVALAKKHKRPRATIAAHLSTLATALYRIGEWQAAVDTFEQARPLYKTVDGSDYYFLAMAHARLNHKRAARECYRKATAWLRGIRKNPRLWKQYQIYEEDYRRWSAEAAQLSGIDERATQER